MSTDLVPVAPLATTRPAASLDLDQLIILWLATKHGRSTSANTLRAYTDAITGFRAALQRAGLDLDSDPTVLAVAALGWCSLGDPAPATFNQRRAILSSFYVFAARQGHPLSNPLARVERRVSHEYAHARALDPATIRDQLAAIDRTTPTGQRDYALIGTYLQTGRRLVEVQRLVWGDVVIGGNQLTLHFRTKGGKTMADQLPAALSRAILVWLQTAYGDLRGLAPDAPLWLSLAPGRGRQQLSTDGVRDVVSARLGATKVHALRHTFARTMEQAGAKASDIQRRLGHASLATTGRYLDALKRAENDQADDLAALFGLDR